MVHRGVVAAPRGRIQFDFRLNGTRYRPSIKRPPSEANLRRARERLEVIKRQIDDGTFSFADEFPDYRFLRRLNGASKVHLCSEVFNEYGRLAAPGETSSSKKSGSRSASTEGHRRNLRAYFNDRQRVRRQRKSLFTL